jgi:hypothetical protein
MPIQNKFGDFTELSLLHKKDPRMREYIDYVIENYSKNFNEINPNNIILNTDSYKLSQGNMTQDINEEKLTFSLARFLSLIRIIISFFRNNIIYKYK